MDIHTDRQRTHFDTKLIYPFFYPFFLKKKVGIITEFLQCVVNLEEQVSVTFDKRETLCILMQYEIELM